MNQKLKGFSQVFSFTFHQHTQRKGYRNTLIIVTLLLLLLPAGIMAWVESGRNAGTADAGSAEIAQIEAVHVADDTDWSVLNDGQSYYGAITYYNYADEAAATAAAGENDLIAVLEQTAEGFSVRVKLPDNTVLTEDDADGYRDYLDERFSAVLRAKAGLAPLPEIATTVAAPDGTKEVLNLASEILPYLNIMVLYFLILFYGQGVANCVILEKTSKLMDFFLVTVKPAGMVLGKVLAMVLAGLLQIGCWIAGMAGGFALGVFLCRTIHPATDMPLVQVLSSLSLFRGMFSLPAILVAIGIILAGFLLYCSLAAVGGSMAGKPEDLSSTNILFTLALIVSFFCCLYSGGMTNGMSSGAEWLNYFPLTAILVTPARVLVGQVSLLTGVLSLAEVLVCSLLVVVLAGKIYEMMSLYKGNPPSVQRMFRMLRQKKTNA
jgi:ABC-type Na+ efflux pump permease subunit